MSTPRFLTNSETFEKEFKKCCEQYNHLELYVAWVGNPGNRIPFDYIKTLKVKATVGISFSQSHPDGIEFLMSLDPSLRIVKDEELFHPKIYIFSKENKKAVFIGSSNFTYSGFYENFEANVLFEGELATEVLSSCQTDLDQWCSEANTFKPDSSWLKNYRATFKKRQVKLLKEKIKDEATQDDHHALASSWLQKANWELYKRNIDQGVRNHQKKFHEGLQEKLDLLAQCKREIPLPWKTSYFDSIENRRKIIGLKPYGWLGHVGASGKVRQLFANGSLKQKEKIVNAINAIGKLSNPIDWTILEKELRSLEALGPSLKVWGRMLAITRPDLYCTVSSLNVRNNLAKILKVSPKYFETTAGYIHLLKLIHSSPWYKSSKPENVNELNIWLNRVAFLDAVFY